jgi:uncharacterized protein (TIGR02466 family)
MEEINTIQEAVYFGNPVWVDHRPEFLNQTITASEKHIKEAKFLNKELSKQTKDFGFSYQSNSLQNDPNFKNLMSYISQRSWEFLDAQGFDLSKHNLLFNDFWVQEFAKNGGGYHDTHVHYNSHVSGFYFLKCSNETSYPIFHDPRPGAVMTKLPLKNLDICHASENIIFKPTPGTIMIFNSYMPHQFVVDHGKDPFRFIHWNIQFIPNNIINK